MFRFAMVAVAGLVMAFQAAPPERPRLTSHLEALTDDASAARTFDYIALKAEGADLGKLSDAVYMRTLPVPGGDRRCLTDAEAEVQMGLAAAIVASDAATFEDDRAAASDAWGKWGLFVEGLANGQVATEPPFSYISGRYAEAAAAADPRVRELLARSGKDQLIRRAFEGGAQIWGELSAGAKGRIDTLLSRQMCETDGENTAWLKADLAANGWYRISVFGDVPSRAAWLMIQHADRDPGFQQQMLALLQPLALEKEVEPWDVALLYDRVAMNAGRPQRYGSQGRCVARNVWGPQPLEDEARVDEYRASVELPPLAEYAAHMNRYCADFEG
ncbi:MAG: hypothetical protein EON85_13865 [Brevundimonas sp.]|nr:MAG: hypothetical protein EON85_13865 [Brevundimonas sp.]